MHGMSLVQELLQARTIPALKLWRSDSRATEEKQSETAQPGARHTQESARLVEGVQGEPTQGSRRAALHLGTARLQQLHQAGRTAGVAPRHLRPSPPDTRDTFAFVFVTNDEAGPR